MVGRCTILTLGLAVLFLLTGLSNNGYGEERYKVRPGDSLSKIAKKHGVTPQALRDANGLQRNALKVRQVLIIPGNKNKAKKNVAKTNKRLPADRAVYVVKKGDTLYSVADHAGISASELKKLNHLRSKKLRKGQRIILQKKEVLVEDEIDDLGDADDIVAGQMADADEDKSSNASVLGKWKNPGERKILLKSRKRFWGFHTVWADRP